MYKKKQVPGWLAMIFGGGLAVGVVMIGFILFWGSIIWGACWIVKKMFFTD